MVAGGEWHGVRHSVGETFVWRPGCEPVQSGDGRLRSAARFVSRAAAAVVATRGHGYRARQAVDRRNDSDHSHWITAVAAHLGRSDLADAARRAANRSEDGHDHGRGASSADLRHARRSRLGMDQSRDAGRRHRLALVAHHPLAHSRCDAQRHRRLCVADVHDRSGHLRRPDLPPHVRREPVGRILHRHRPDLGGDQAIAAV